MFNLILNENMKIFRRMRTWILSGALVLGILLVAIVMNNNVKTNADWKAQLVTQNQQLQTELHHANSHRPASVTHGIEAQIQINQYSIDHNTPPSSPTAWSFGKTIINNLGGLVGVLITIIAADIVASEFSGGTIKALLTRPVTRTQIILSKYMSTLIFAIYMLAITLVGSLIIGSAFFGMHGANQPYVYVNASQAVTQVSMVKYLWMSYGYQSISMLMAVTLAFMLSAVFRSSSVAIAVAVISMFLGSAVTRALSNYAWVKYLLWPNTDLQQYFQNGPSIAGMTLGFSIIMLILYFVVMNFLSWRVFTKRDVAG